MAYIYLTDLLRDLKFKEVKEAIEKGAVIDDGFLEMFYDVANNNLENRTIIFELLRLMEFIVLYHSEDPGDKFINLIDVLIHKYYFSK